MRSDRFRNSRGFEKYWIESNTMEKEIDFESGKQYLLCPSNTASIYRAYMRDNDIAFEEGGLEYSEVLEQEQCCFIIDRSLNPHDWKMPEIDGGNMDKGNPLKGHKGDSELCSGIVMSKGWRDLHGL